MSKQKYGYYTKKPLWQLIIVYLVFAALIYGLIYYFIFAQKNDSNDIFNYGSYSNGKNTSSKSPYGY